MTDAFANVVGPVFQHLIDFQQRLGQGSHPALDDERSEVMVLLDEAEQKAHAAGHVANDFEMARYALVYWIDEVLINSSWRYATDWREHILEWDFYHDRLGGEQFYEKAKEAEALASTDPLETFYLCVALGFRGKFANNRTSLQSWAERAYGRIAAGSKQPDRFLPDESRDLEREPLRSLAGRSVLLAVSMLVSATALFTLVCFLLAVHFS